MDITFEFPNGETYNTKDYDMKVLELVIGTPSMDVTTMPMSGRDGFVHLGTDLGGRTLKMKFLVQGVDADDLALLRDDIFRFLITKYEVYIYDSRESHKRWKARLHRNFDFTQIAGHQSILDVEFMAQPYAESKGTTLDAFTFDSEVWGVGMNLDTSDYNYDISGSNTFQIYNASDKVIDPREDDLEITFTNGATAFTGLTIDNTTTGDTWKYTGTVNASDVIVLSGVRSLKNGISIFPDTNNTLITLNEGYNDFTISGTTDFQIKFKFRFKLL